MKKTIVIVEDEIPLYENYREALSKHGYDVQGYHDRISATLAALKEKHGYALLWDAHSIPSSVPSLFDGELPELNIGTWDGRS